MHHLSNRAVLAEVCEEYWRQKKARWRYLEFLLREFKIIKRVDPPSREDIDRAMREYTSTSKGSIRAARSTCRCWPTPPRMKNPVGRSIQRSVGERYVDGAIREFRSPSHQQPARPSHSALETKTRHPIAISPFGRPDRYCGARLPGVRSKLLLPPCEGEPVSPRHYHASPVGPTTIYGRPSPRLRQGAPRPGDVLHPIRRSRLTQKPG